MVLAIWAQVLSEFPFIWRKFTVWILYGRILNLREEIEFGDNSLHIRHRITDAGIGKFFD